ncbi:MAG: archaellin/type IV pilin N-terminal domain-containing protein [Nanoarchaeota archaeon]
MKRKGLSPVIATVLLIAIVLLLAAIIFLWARGLLTERNQKFDEPVENACGDVNFEAEAYFDSDKYTLGVVNKGTVPIYSIELKIRRDGAIRDLKVLSLEDGKYGTIRSGESKLIDLGNEGDIEVGDELEVIPIILGQKGGVKTPFPCESDQGQRINIKSE